MQHILTPKVESPEQVAAVAERTAALAAACGRAEPIWLMPIVESAMGGLRALAIATAAPSVAALTLGLEDYTADIGVQRTAGGQESFWLR